MSATFTGTSGVIRWGYLPAASVSSWTVVVGSDGWQLSGTVHESDAFRVSQRPLTFVVPRPTGDWQWPILTLQIDGTTVHGTVRPSQEA